MITFLTALMPLALISIRPVAAATPAPIEKLVEQYFNAPTNTLGSIVEVQKIANLPVDLVFEGIHAKEDQSRQITRELMYVRTSKGLLCRLGLGYYFSPLKTKAAEAPRAGIYAECVNENDIRAVHRNLSSAFGATRDLIFMQVSGFKETSMNIDKWVLLKRDPATVILSESHVPPVLVAQLLFYIDAPNNIHSPVFTANAKVLINYRRSDGSEDSMESSQKVWSLDPANCATSLGGIPLKPKPTVGNAVLKLFMDVFKK